MFDSSFIQGPRVVNKNHKTFNLMMHIIYALMVDILLVTRWLIKAVRYILTAIAMLYIYVFTIGHYDMKFVYRFLVEDKNG